MAALKTKENKASVSDFIGKVADEGRRKDCKTIVKLMREATGEKPRMWGGSIVGFGRYRYKYASGQESEWQGWRTSGLWREADSPLTSHHSLFTIPFG